MKALILAAGPGTRIQSVHGDRPKCLIRFNDSRSTILDHQIKNLLSAGVNNIGIVVGYEKDQIIQHVATRYGAWRRNFFFIENPIFAKTNNTFSLWLAQTWLHGEPFICLNADVVFDPRILTPAIESTTPISLIVDSAWRDEATKVIISGNRIVRMGQRIPQSEFSGSCIGITTFAAGVQEALFAKVKKLIRAGKENEIFHIAVQQLADEGLHVGFARTGGLPWAEIDDPGDLAFARLYIFPRLVSLPAAA
jgi:choline kinase